MTGSQPNGRCAAHLKVGRTNACYTMPIQSENEDVIKFIVNDYGKMWFEEIINDW